MAAARRFPPAVLKGVRAGKYFGIRAGDGAHRFIGIWMVVVVGRVFVRSWTLTPEGWYRTFLSDPGGAIRLADRTVRIRAVHTRSERLLSAVDRAYAEKYVAPESGEPATVYVQGDVVLGVRPRLVLAWEYATCAYRTDWVFDED